MKSSSSSSLHIDEAGSSSLLEEEVDALEEEQDATLEGEEAINDLANQVNTISVDMGFEEVPNDLQGAALVKHFTRLYHKEKTWLRYLVDLRFRMLDMMESMIQEGMEPFTMESEEPNSSSSTHDAGLSQLAKYRDLVYEMIGYNERLKALWDITWEYRMKFLDNEHLVGLAGKRRLKRSDKYKIRAQNFDSDVQSILGWSKEMYQPNEIIHDSMGWPIDQVMDSMRQEADGVAYRLGAGSFYNPSR